MQEVMQGRTAIVIAHRLGTVKHLDRLVVLENGKIIEDGDHKELMKQKRQYYKMVELQS
jgi:ABC-type multidrug transport system fused ATPase/permease subunit